MDDLKNLISDLKDTGIYTSQQLEFAAEAAEKAFDSAWRLKEEHEGISDLILELLCRHFRKLASMSDTEIAREKEQLIPQDELFWKLLERFQRPEFKSARSTPSDLPRHPSLAPFFMLNIMRPNREGKTIALTTSFQAFPYALCRPILWAWRRLERVLKSGAGASAGKVNGFAQRRIAALDKETVDHFNFSVKRLGNKYWQLLKNKFWPFRDSTEFYAESDPVYGEPLDNEDAVFVFSTTSGLMIPEEYYGASVPPRLWWLKEAAAAKNPARLEYFRHGIFSPTRTIPVCYAWDRQRTRETFRSGYRNAPNTESKNLYRREAARILSRALASTNLQVVQMDFERAGKWYLDPRAYLTLTSKRYAIWSWRPPRKEGAHIGHGLKLDGASFGKLLNLIAASGGIASLAMHSGLLSLLLAAVPFLPEEELAGLAASKARNFQHMLAQRLYMQGPQRKLIKGFPNMNKMQARAKATEVVEEELSGLL